ncbi:MAG: flagellar basal body-associated FliL family protein [Thermodesulfobacteriota bacterium]
MKKKGLFIFLAPLVILGLGGGLIYFLKPSFLTQFLPNHAGTKTEQYMPKKEKGFLYKMDPLIVNLADAETLHYLKIKIDLESMEEKPNEEFEKRLPQIRDNILLLLSTKERKVLMDAEGKNKLRAEIREKVNQLLKNFKIKDIYFTEFLIQ